MTAPLEVGLLGHPMDTAPRDGRRVQLRLLEGWVRARWHRERRQWDGVTQTGAPWSVYCEQASGWLPAADNDD
jgi:hypothetical protein